MKRNFLSILTLLVLTAVNAQATTWYVASNGSDSNPGTQAQPFQTIQKGINTAQNGDTVLVGNGTYTGAGNKNLDFGGRLITLMSQGGATNCIIDCQQSGRGFWFHSGETAQAVVDGFTIRNGGNVPAGQGGGIFNDDASSPTITNCTFSNNSATHGGAIYNESSSSSIANCTFSGNGATQFGGGIYNGINSNPTVTNCTFNGNTASSGAGMYTRNSSATVTNCNFTGNTATAGGGGVFNYTSSPNLTFCTFTGNTANNGGGMVNDVGSNPTITRCTFTQNTASNSGAGMSNSDGSNPNVTYCTFTQNTATNAGGGMTNSGNNSIITNCTFSGNTADKGGGMVNINSGPTITHCTFSRNVSDDGGGMYNDLSNTAMVIHCLFTGNKATFGGGGMFQRECSLTVTNCLFSGNTAANGGGMNNFNNSDPKVTYCTFSGNRATTNGGGMDNSLNNSNPIVAGCILWGNTSGEITRDPAVVTYSNIQGYSATPDASNNFGADPRFVRNPSPGTDTQWGTPDDDYGDLRLLPDSPCINRGQAGAPNLPPYDLQGFIRVQGSAPDQGPYEFGSTPYIAADLYVDKINGSDANNGTAGAPFQTVNKALSMVSAPIGFTRIYVKAGNYGSDRPRVIQGVRFVNWTNNGQARIGQP